MAYTQKELEEMNRYANSSSISKTGADTPKYLNKGSSGKISYPATIAGYMSEDFLNGKLMPSEAVPKESAYPALNTSTSIVDYLKSTGQDSSFNNRKKLAADYGISGYSGTAEQNISLLKLLKNGSAPAPVMDSGSSNESARDATVAAGSKNVTAEGNTLSHDGNTQVTAGSAATPASKFEVSDAYLKAMEYTNSMLSQLNSGRTSYTGQIEALLKEYQNREAFSYDPSTDPMFQQMLASAMDSGKLAMEDTVGQAAALTGGYGSSYGTRVGNEAYSRYLSEAYGNLPDYYYLAMEAYNAAGNQMLNELGLLQNADNQEYERMMNAYSASLSEAERLYQQEYGQWQDALAQENWESSFAYQQSQDALAQRNWQDSFAYQKSQDALAQKNLENSLAYQKEQDALAQKNLENSLAYQKEQDALAQKNWQDSFAYQQSQDALAQKNRETEFDYQKYRDGLNYSSKQAQDEAVEGKLTTPKDTMYEKALESVLAGGEGALVQYLDTVPDYDTFRLMEHAYKGSTWTKTEETTNWLGGVDHDDIVVDGFGNPCKIGDLAVDKETKKKLSKLKKGESYSMINLDNFK